MVVQKLRRDFLPYLEIGAGADAVEQGFVKVPFRFDGNAAYVGQPEPEVVEFAAAKLGQLEVANFRHMPVPRKPIRPRREV